MRHWYCEYGFKFVDDDGKETDSFPDAKITVERDSSDPKKCGEWIISFDPDDAVEVHPLFKPECDRGRKTPFVQRLLGWCASKRMNGISWFLMRKYMDGGWKRTPLSTPGMRWGMPRGVEPVEFALVEGYERVAFRPDDVLRVRKKDGRLTAEKTGFSGFSGFEKDCEKLSGEGSVFVLFSPEKEEIRELEEDTAFNPLRIFSFIRKMDAPLPVENAAALTLPAGTMVHVEKMEHFEERIRKIIENMGRKRVF